MENVKQTQMKPQGLWLVQGTLSGRVLWGDLPSDLCRPRSEQDMSAQKGQGLGGAVHAVLIQEKLCPPPPAWKSWLSGGASI